MRLLTLAISVSMLLGVAYVSFSTPSSDKLFSGDMQIASATPAR